MDPESFHIYHDSKILLKKVNFCRILGIPNPRAPDTSMLVRAVKRVMRKRGIE